jgi:hypothetical protein
MSSRKFSNGEGLQALVTDFDAMAAIVRVANGFPVNAAVLHLFVGTGGVGLVGHISAAPSVVAVAFAFTPVIYL